MSANTDVRTKVWTTIFQQIDTLQAVMTENSVHQLRARLMFGSNPFFKIELKDADGGSLKFDGDVSRGPGPSLCTVQVDDVGRESIYERNWGIDQGLHEAAEVIITNLTAFVRNTASDAKDVEQIDIVLPASGTPDVTVTTDSSRDWNPLNSGIAVDPETGSQNWTASVIDGQIAKHGYKLSPRSVFEREAPQGLVDRAKANSTDDGGYSWVLWDPQDDSGGLLVTSDNQGALRSEFIEIAAHWSENENGEALPPPGP